MTWQEAMDRFGSDKPDIRFGMELQDVSEVVKGCGFGVFTGALENGGTVRGINAKGQGHMPRKKIDALVEYAKTYGAKGSGLSVQSMKMELTNLLLQNSMTEEELKALGKSNGRRAGRFAAVCRRQEIRLYGMCSVHCVCSWQKSLDLLKKDEYNFLWVTEFPLLEWSEEQNRFVAMHHPFTMPMEEDLG